MMVHPLELGISLIGSLRQVSSTDIRMQKRVAESHSVSDIRPVFESGVSSHVDIHLNDQIVASDNVVAIDDEILGDRPLGDFLIQGHVISTRKLGALCIRSDGSDDFSVDGSISNGIADAFCVGSCGGSGRQTHELLLLGFLKGQGV